MCLIFVTRLPNFTHFNLSDMANVTFLTFNPFQENTYIVYDETGETVALATILTMVKKLQDA